MHRIITATLCACFIAVPAWASELSTRLMEVAQIERLLAQLSREAERSAVFVDDDFLDGNGGPVFHDTIKKLNDPARLTPRFEELLMEKLDDQQVEALLLFFESALGQKIVELELSAREVMFDDEVEQSVREQVAQTGTPDLVLRMIEEGDLIERNIVDAMSALRQFYLGQIDGGLPDFTKSDVESLLAESEEAMRIDTQIWLESFLTFAYSPLDEADLTTYVELWETQTGKAYDTALFYAFATLFEEIGFATGQLVARLSQVNDI
ncbi:MAG: DUF2059 domain-containing protein [Paracoccaceae bacterium]